MILPDVNVLIYAFRPDASRHGTCRGWLEKVLAGDARFGMSKLALSALVRITSTPHIFRQPSTTDDAFRFCDYIIAQPHCQLIEPGDHHWDIFKRLCAETGTRGGTVTDAWFAALAIEWGCEWITFDRHFKRFPGLKISTPAD